MLTKLGVQFIHQYPVKPYVADFAIPSLKLLVECDGHRWHSSPESLARSEKRDAFLINHGYRVLHLTEPCIKDWSAMAIIAQVIQAADDAMAALEREGA